MRSIPYGYRIMDGHAVIDKAEAEKVTAAFERYLAGETLMNIGSELGIAKYHRSMALILEDSRYMGNGFYPQIVPERLFDEVQEERDRRKKKHARKERSVKEPEPLTSFIYKPGEKHFSNPFEQAAYVYSRIGEADG